MDDANHDRQPLRSPIATPEHSIAQVPTTPDQMGRVARRVLSREATQNAPNTFKNNLRYFIKIGLPLSVSALLNWGLPSIAGMVFAGHTEDSAHLQAALGYGRVWYMITGITPCMSMIAYISTMLPSCIGAKREDKILPILRRSYMMCMMFMLPIYVLQYFSYPVLLLLGLPQDIAEDVQLFNRIMIPANAVCMLNCHIENMLVNLGFAKSVTVVSLVGGSLNVFCSYLFLYRLSWGVMGNAVGSIGVETGKIMVFGIIICIWGLWKPRPRTDGGAVTDSAPESFVSRKDVWDFVSLWIPQMLSILAGHVVYELQMIALTNIRDIPKDALAAGASWVQLEGMLAASMSGCVICATNRTITLLGKMDLGAKNAFVQIVGMAFGVVAIVNVLMLVFSSELCALMSNDENVQDWLQKIFWVLVVHSQSKVGSWITANLFIPVGRGTYNIVWTFVSFYCIASPIALFVSLTDIVTDDIATKMFACVGLTSIAQIMQFLAFTFALGRMDWQQAARTIAERVADEEKDETKAAGAS